MTNPMKSFQEASSETKMFVLTVIVLAVIVLGTFFYAYYRIDGVRSGPKKVNATESASLIERESLSASIG